MQLWKKPLGSWAASRLLSGIPGFFGPQSSKNKAESQVILPKY